MMPNDDAAAYRETMPFWRDADETQNFGDFLTPYLMKHLFLRVPRLPGDVRIIGSYLSDYHVGLAKGRKRNERIPGGKALTAWAAGLREPQGISGEALSLVELLSVRGPLTARELGREGTLPLGDPGLLLPALYRPHSVPEFQCVLCIPHFNDVRDDAEICRTTGADRVLWPRLSQDLADVESFLDRLTSAEFVLCGSLHAAIAAAAYGIPFAFWDSGAIDIPFKWNDFAASIGIECEFLPDVAAGRTFFASSIAGRITLPCLWPMLAAAPYPIRSDAMLRLLEWQASANPGFRLSDIANLFEANRGRQQRMADEADTLMAALATIIEQDAERVRLLADELASAEAQLSASELASAQSKMKVDALESALAEGERRADLAEKIAQEYEGALQAAKAKAEEFRTNASASMVALGQAGHLSLEELGRASRNWSDGRQDEVHLHWSTLVSSAFHLFREGFSEWKVEDWGDRDSVVGQPVNEQPDGSSAIWIRIFGIPVSETLAVQFGQHPSRQAHRESADLVTCGIPDEVLQRCGTYHVSLIDTQGRHIHVGFFRVRPRQSWMTFWKTLRSRTRGPRVDFSQFDWSLGGLRKEGIALDPAHSGAQALRWRILVADDRIPRSDASAGERATIGLLGDLVSLGFEVVFIATDMRDDVTCRKHLEDLGVTVVSRSLRQRRAVDYVLSKGASFNAFYLIRVDVAEELLSATRRVAPNARIIFHAPDLHFLRESRAAAFAGSSDDMEAAQQTKSREATVMRSSDCVVVVSPVEKALAQEVVPEAQIAVFPALYSSVIADPPDFDERANIVFVGGFGHQPNISAVQWFVGEIWPSIFAANPDVEFHIVGADAPEEVISLGRRPGVKFVGHVDVLEHTLKGYRVNVAPLLVGAGIKGKLGSAMGVGTPSVTTTIGAEGMGIDDGVQSLVRDDAETFAAAVLELYGNKEIWRELSRAGRRLVEDKFGGAANQAALARALELAGALPQDLYTRHCSRRSPVSLPVWTTPHGSPVSVAISAHDRWEVTRACLNSVAIACTSADVSYDIHLCALPEEHGAILRDEFPGVHQGSPFLDGETSEDGCSISDKWLIHLSAGMIAMPNWLISLLETARQNPSAAIVGSKIVGSDGSILEAGGVLFSDGSSVPVGFGAASSEPVYTFDREVDCVGRSSFLVRQSIWSSSERQAETSAGDPVDSRRLAMLVRERGMRVFFSAHSVAVQAAADFTMSSPTTLTPALENVGSTFQQQWHAQLKEQQLPPGTDPMVAAAHAERHPPPSAMERRRKGQLNILYFSPFPSHPNNHGNQATIQAFGKRFQKMGHRVHFALLESSLYGDEDREAMRQCWDSLELIQHSCKLWSDGSDIPFDGWYDESLGKKIRVLCDKHQIDVVFCSYVFQSKLLEYVPAHILKVIDTHDKMGNRYQMLRENGQPVEFFSCTPEEEGAYLRRADIVAARRYEEAKYFDSVTGSESAIVLSHVEEPQFSTREFRSLKRVGIVASANRINLIILHDFLAELGRRCGDHCSFEVEVAGQVRQMIGELDDEQRRVFERPWLRMLGFVPDIAEFYDRLDLVVSPVTMGTGINVKSVQAMAYGMPLITTRVGIKGIETRHELHQHESLVQLVSSLLDLSNHQEYLSELAAVSVCRYREFLVQNEAAFEGLLDHDKTNLQ